jgi:hypothetical protein
MSHNVANQKNDLKVDVREHAHAHRSVTTWWWCGGPRRWHFTFRVINVFPYFLACLPFSISHRLLSTKKTTYTLRQIRIMYYQTVIQFNISSSSVSSLNLASLSMNECDSTTLSPVQRLSNGWGSQETRKAYTSLQTLADCQDNAHHGKSRQRSNSTTSSSSAVVDQQASDVFLSDDEMDCDENFWWFDSAIHQHVHISADATLIPNKP